MTGDIRSAVLALPPDVAALLGNLLLDLLPDPATEVEYRRQLACEAARDAYVRGYLDGHRHGARQLEAEWPAVVKPLDGPTNEELESLRWGPGGRGHFAAPRPGDRFPETTLEVAS